MSYDMSDLVSRIYTNMANVFKSGDDIEPIIPFKFEELDETYFTATLLALQMQFQAITGNKLDTIEFVHILNKLAIQHLLNQNTKANEQEV